MTKIPKPSGALPNTLRSKGLFYFRQTRHGLVVQNWPRKRTKGYSAYDVERMAQFKIAAQWANNHEPIGRITAENWAKNSLYVWRDILIGDYFANYTRIRDQDGNILLRDWEVNPSAQLILEQLGDIPGSIPYRDQLLWENLLPGTNGHILTMLAGLPSWQPNAGGAPPTAHYLLLDVAPGLLTNARQLILATGLTSSSAIAGQFLLGVNADAILGLLGAASHGALLYKGASGWLPLAPGILGDILQSGGAAANPGWVAGSGGAVSACAISVYDASATPTIAAAAKVVDVYLWGDGGGGGSGATQASGSAASGGGGGGPGAYSWARYRRSMLGTTEAIVIGPGGAGGAQITASNSNGNAGAPGTGSSFSTGANLLRAAGGGGGGAGQRPGGSTGGVISAYGRLRGQPGAAGVAGAQGTSPLGGTDPCPTGGGSGAGHPVTAVSLNGGAGGAFGTTSAFTQTGATGGAGASGGDGADGAATAVEGGTGLGGGGGGYQSGAGGGRGGDGGAYGGGGGGGAAARNTFTAKRGGNGYHGGCILFQQF